MLARPLALHLVPVGVALAVGGAAAPAAAAGRVRPIQDPLHPTVASGVRAATGDGRVAWTVRGDGGSDPAVPATTALWTVRDGAPVQVGTLRDGRPVTDLELGSDADGVPVAYVESSGGRPGGAARRLVRLDTGQVRRIPLRHRGRLVSGMAIDHGRLYSTEDAGGGPSLWRAALTGLDPGRPTRIRTSRGPESWGDVAADRGRIAVETTRDVREEGQDLSLVGFAFGTPRGRWARGGSQYIGDGPFDTVTVGGFTQDRSAIVLVTAVDATDLTASAVPLSGRGRVRSAHLWNQDFDTAPPVFDPATGRFFGDGPTTAAAPTAGGPTAVGYTAPVFPTG
jgi:hypothetical protein